jgi:hypothetical protein
MQKFFISFILTLSFAVLFYGCGSDNTTNPTISSKGEHLRMSESTRLYHQQLDMQLQKSLEKFYSVSYSDISQRINEEAVAADFNLTQNVHDSIITSIQKSYQSRAKKAFQKTFAKELAKKFKDFRQSIDIDNSSLRITPLTQSEKETLTALISDFFTQNLSDITSMYQTNLKLLVDDHFQTDLLMDSSTNTKNTFSATQKSEEFKKKMSAYFKDFNTSRDNDVIVSTAQHFVDKVQITNTFNGAVLHEHKPTYDTDGNIESISDITHDIVFPKRDTNSPRDAQYYLATSIDLHGTGIPSLLIFKQYEKSYAYYAYELTTKGSLNFLNEIPSLHHLTDIVAGDIDNDGYDEIIVAQGSPENRVTIYDDATHGFHETTSFSFFDDIGMENGVIRLAIGDSDADGYDEIAAVCYDEQAIAWKAHLKVWDLKNNPNHESTSILNEKMSYSFPANTPVDILFSDLNEVDNIELFAVQVDEKIDSKQRGYHQPDQGFLGADDYCMYFVESTNQLNIFHFKDYESPDIKALIIKNYTYDKRYASSRRGTDNGAWCDSNGVCICTSDYKASPYHLYVPVDKVWRPLYITAYHTSLDEPATLDIDGYSYEFSQKSSTSYFYPAKYYQVTHGHTYDDEKHTYTPVRSNASKTASSARKYVTHIKEGQRFYVKSKYPRSIPTTSNITKDFVESVYRVYNDEWPHIRRLATFGNPTRTLEYLSHNVIYSQPIITYVLGTPPSVGKSVEMSYTQEKCHAEKTMDKSLYGAVFGISVTTGFEAKFLGEGARITATLGFDTLQSSGHIDETKTEICTEGTVSLNDSDDDIVIYHANIADNFTYVVTKDLSDSSYVYAENSPNNKTIHITQQRASSAFPYEVQTTVKELYDSLEAQGVEPEVDIRGLLKHKKDNLSSYLTQKDFDTIVGSGSELSNALKSLYSDQFSYSQLWFTKQNVLIPDAASNEQKFTQTLSITDGEEEHDSYKYYAKVAMEYEAVSVLQGAEVEFGIETSFYHENLNEESDSTSYGLKISDKVDDLTYSHVGLFSFVAKPLSDKECSLKTIWPLNRVESSKFNPDEKVSCHPPILVIDYWLTNQTESEDF